MELPRTVEGLRSLLDIGTEANHRITASDGTGTWTLLHWAAFIGDEEMASLLLERGASIELLANDGRSALDVAGDAGNEQCSKVLGRAADRRYIPVKHPFLPTKMIPGDFYPSKFYLALQDPFERLSKSVELKEFEDMIQNTRALKESGRLGTFVPYPDENRHLVDLYQQVTVCASKLEAEGEHLERGLAFAKFWLQRCFKHHICMTKLRLSKMLWPVLPKRVVDVSQMDRSVIKLVDGFPRRAPYCTVSYRWRGPSAKTTQESITAFRQRIPLGGLRPQLRDALFIAHKLGIRYVWIDALCIVQRSAAGPGDFDEQAPRMANIYGEATLTLAFADDSRFGVAHASVGGNRPTGELDTRGWVLQEQLLSQRVLYITKSGLYWECLENSMSECCPCGIPGSTDNFRSVDQRRLKNCILQGVPSHQSKQALLCMWRRNVVEEYSRRLLSCSEDRVVAAASITDRISIALNDQYFLGIWKNDAVNSLFWHTVAPCERSRGLVFPSWSWFSVQGPVVYSSWTPFSGSDVRGQSCQSLNGFMEAEHVRVLEIHCEEVQRNRRAPNRGYQGHVKLEGLTLRAYFAPGNSDVLFFPRKRGAEAELVRDIQQGTLRPARHDGGEQEEHRYVVEFPFIDRTDFPGSDRHREVLCMIMGRNKNDGFPVALILEKTKANGDCHQYERVGTVAIDTRQIRLAGTSDGGTWAWSDVMGEMRTLVIV